MNAKIRFLAVLSLVALVSACADKDADPKAAAVPADTASVAVPVPTEVQPVPPQPVSVPAAEQTPVAAGFDINSVPITDKDIGEFPFFTPPEEHKYVSAYSSSLDESKSVKNFTRYYFPIGEEELYPVEGKNLKAHIYNIERKSISNADVLLIQRNYENAITAVGGAKVFDGKTNTGKTYNLLQKKGEDQYMPVNIGGIRHVYIIRKQDMEVWFEVNCDSDTCSIGVSQKGEMKQSVGIIPASEMKKELDKVGHIALYINFDVDKAVIRPESQGTVNEIAKLLETYLSLKIRIEGHTDNVGEAEHNATLSNNRAASVYGALLARGITQDRLEAKGFGMTHPIADNGTEEGRAKNRRVEIVKISE